MEEFLLFFLNTYDSMKCEKILRENNININIMPTPSYLTNSCGISIRFNLNSLEKILDLIKKNELNYKGIYNLNTKQLLNY